MQSSDRLNLKKNNIEVMGRIDSIDKKINSLKKDMENLKESFNTYIKSHKKSITELYAFCNKLEEIYFNGLNSNLNSNSNSNSNLDSNSTSNLDRISKSSTIIENMNDTFETGYDNSYTISNDIGIKQIYSTESTKYDNLTTN